MSIGMPNEEEKKRSIDYILDEGIVEKRYLSFNAALLIQKIGLKNLFWGTWDCIFLALVSSVIFGILLVIPAVLYIEFLPVALLLISPAAYTLLHFFTMWKERQVGLYEIKMTSFYSFRELTALRMIFFGGAGAVLDIIFALYMQQRTVIMLSFVQMLGISLSSLFLYGSAALFALSRGSHRIVPAVWCAVCAAPVVFNIDVLSFMIKIPGAAAAAFAVLTLVLFFIEIKNYIYVNYKGGYYNAVN